MHYLVCPCNYLQGSWVRYPVWQHTFVSPSTFSRRAVVSYWRKYVHEVLVNRLGGLSLPRKSVVRLTYHPDMTLDVYCGRKTTMQQQQLAIICSNSFSYCKVDQKKTVAISQMFNHVQLHINWMHLLNTRIYR